MNDEPSTVATNRDLWVNCESSRAEIIMMLRCWNNTHNVWPSDVRCQIESTIDDLERLFDE